MFGTAAIQAQDYRTHKIKVGETIESIAKQYKVTPYDIFSLNPDARKGLEVNTILIIPNSKISGDSEITTIQELDGFKEHKVRRKETLFSLSKKYGVSEEQIKKHNPELYSKNLRRGKRLKIPIYKT